MRIWVNFWTYGKALSQHVPGSYDQSTGFSFTGEVPPSHFSSERLVRSPFKLAASQENGPPSDSQPLLNARDKLGRFGWVMARPPAQAQPVRRAGTAPLKGSGVWHHGEGSLRSLRHFFAKTLFLRVPEHAATVYPVATRWHLVFGNRVPFLGSSVIFFIFFNFFFPPFELKLSQGWEALAAQKQHRPLHPRDFHRHGSIVKISDRPFCKLFSQTARTSLMLAAACPRFALLHLSPERCCCGDLGLQVTWRENFVRHRHPAQQCSLWRLGFDMELNSREIPSSVNRKDTGGVCVCL